MRKVICITLSLAAFLITGCQREPQKTTVLCGTTMMLSLVRDVAPGIEAAVLIPPQVCPSDFDLKPADAEKAVSAKVLIIEPFLAPAAEKIKKINPSIAVGIITAPDMTIPSHYFSGLNECAAILAEHFPEGSKAFYENAAAKIKLINERVVADTVYINKLRGEHYPALCSMYQRGFSDYVGFRAIAVFSDPDKLSVKALEETVALAKQQKVKFIISNMTGRHDDTADIINRHLKVKKMVLINFPGETTAPSMFLSLWEYNLDQIKNIIGVLAECGPR